MATGVSKPIVVVQEVAFEVAPVISESATVIALGGDAGAIPSPSVMMPVTASLPRSPTTRLVSSRKYGCLSLFSTLPSVK